MLADLKIAYQFPEAADASGITKRELHKLVKAGDLDVFLAGNRVLITRTSLEAFCYGPEVESRHERCTHE